MGSPTIFSGSYTKLLTSGGIQMQNGMIIQNDGPTNYIKNYGAEVGTSGWATYADSAANIPADGTGGTATGLTFSRSTSSPLIGAGQFSMVQANSTSLQGKGVSYDFTIDSAYKAQALAVRFNFNASSTFVASNGTTAPLNDGTTSTNAGNSDIEVFIYDVTNAVLLPVSPQVITANGSNNFVFNGIFQTSSNSTSYRLIFHVATTSANATGWTFLFDRVYVGPQTLAQGAPITDPVTFTPTITGFGTLSAVTAYYYREGKFMIGEITAVGGTVTGSTFDLTIPGSLSVDTTLMSSTSNGQTVGYLDHATSGSTSIPSNSNGPFYIFYDGATTTKLYCANATTSQAYTKATGSNILSNSNPFTIKFRIPIQGWSSNVTMSNDTDTRVVAASAHVSSAASTTSSNPINFEVVDFDTHGAITTGVGTWKYTVPVSGIYQVVVNYYFGATSQSLSLYKNGVKGRLLSSSVSGTTQASGATTISCVAGDTLDLRPGGTVTPTTDGGSIEGANNVSIQRLSGPSTIATLDTIAARATKASGTQTMSNNNSYQKITFTSLTEGYDRSGSYDTTNSKFTVPVSGIYTITGKIEVNATNVLANQYALVLYKNGVSYMDLDDYKAVASTFFDMRGTTDLSLLAGDYLELYFYGAGNNSASTLTIGGNVADNWFCIRRVGN